VPLYTVDTEHPTFPGFISPIRVGARSPLEAARKRFALQEPKSQAATTSVRARESGTEATWIFPVVSRPSFTVGDPAIEGVQDD